MYAASLAQSITALYKGSTGVMFPIHPLSSPFSVRVTNTPFGFFRFSEITDSIDFNFDESPFMEKRAKSKSIFLSSLLSIKNNTCITNNAEFFPGYISRISVNQNLRFPLFLSGYINQYTNGQLPASINISIFI